MAEGIISAVAQGVISGVEDILNNNIPFFLNSYSSE